MSKRGVPRHILWSKDRIDLEDPWQRRWYIRQTLVYGRAEDIAALDWDEVWELLPELELPPEVRRLWESFFAEEEG